MKLLVAIVQEDDASAILEALSGARLRATRIASSGGFLRGGNATIFAGVDEQAIPLALDLFSRHCQRRMSSLPSDPYGAPHEWSLPEEVQVEVGGAVIFVLNVVRFEQLA